MAMEAEYILVTFLTAQVLSVAKAYDEYIERLEGCTMLVAIRAI